jgi:Uma2 family endonuclease
MAGAQRKQKVEKYSYADYLSWTDERRYEIINGVVYDMNAPSRLHQEYVVEFVRLFANFFADKPCKVYVAPFDVRLPRKSKRDKDIYNVVQPDISIVCDNEKLDDKGCIGAPDMIIEVISPTTSSRDNILKRALYEKAGVKEFWLLHSIDQLLTVYRLGKNGYTKPEIYDAYAEVAPGIFPELKIDLKTILNPVEVPDNPGPGARAEL